VRRPNVTKRAAGESPNMMVKLNKEQRRTSLELKILNYGVAACLLCYLNATI
jgi:hypothetical protein